VGYTKFALKYLTVPGEVMPKCCGDRVVEFDISINSEITLCPDSSSACLFIITPSDINEDEINAKSPIEWGANEIMVDDVVKDIHYYTVIMPYLYLRNFLDGQLCFAMWKDLKSEIKLDLKTIANKYPKIKVYMYDFSNDGNFYMPTINSVPNPHKAVQTLNFV
jgi:hypothetical protein